MKISIVIPVFNEEKRVEQAINALQNYLPQINFDPEVIFVDDGSLDKTVETISFLKPNFKYQLISYQPNKGKGYALKQGILRATGDYVLFMDADMSTPIEELRRFLPEVENNTAAIIGSRKTRGANVVKHQKAWRQKLGEGFTLLSNILLVPGITDFTCGFKIFRSDAAKKVFRAQKIKRWGYDSEILFLAKKYGYEIKEIPVTWVNDERTKVNLVKDVWRSFTDLLKIRYYDLRGFYSK